MARRLRIEFPGALYHLINRGNYRRAIFRGEGEARAFLDTLEQTVVRYGWRLHAWVLMSNHYHLAVETPQPNLVDGMHWLQTTFSTRFNRLRRERGHLFQGRYESILVEDFRAMAVVADYIHLNPVRARLVAPEGLVDYRWSSLAAEVRREGLAGRAADWLATLGYEDTAAGWSRYLENLVARARDEGGLRREGQAFEDQGWAVGTDGWKRALAESHSHLALAPGLAAAERQALREGAWRAALRSELEAAGLTETALVDGIHAKEWRLALAEKVRARSGASISWLARELRLGSPDTARSRLSLRRRKSQNSA